MTIHDAIAPLERPQGARLPAVDEAAPPIRMRLTGDADVAVGTMTVTSGFRGRLRHETDHLVIWAHIGTVRISGPDAAGPLAAGVPFVLTAGRSYAIESTPARLSVIRVSDDCLRRALETAGVADARSGPIAERPDPMTASPLHIAMRSIVPALFEPTGPEHRGLADQVVAAVVAAFCSDPLPLPEASGVPTTRLDRALTLIRDRAREPIGVAEVAAAARLTNRGVQQLFQRELGRTPTEVLRSTRLDGSRVDLRNAVADARIADIAHAWQFHHLGRFAGLYRSRFGESPSRTLRAHRGRSL
jgi:AraC-like DNA-binding protein